MALELYGVSDVDELIVWAHNNGMHYDVESDSIVCYKSVLAIPTDNCPCASVRFFAENDILTNPFEYPWRGFVKTDKINKDPRVECAEGLHGAGYNYVKTFGRGRGEQAILRLEVNLLDNVIVVPYLQNAYPIRHCKKFRFKQCHVDSVMEYRRSMPPEMYKAILQLADAKDVQKDLEKNGLKKENSDGHYRLLRDLHGVQTG